jgi:hypothetical protein
MDGKKGTRIFSEGEYKSSVKEQEMTAKVCVQKLA